jgi:hypothetical protein
MPIRMTRSIGCLLNLDAEGDELVLKKEVNEDEVNDVIKKTEAELTDMFYTQEDEENILENEEEENDESESEDESEDEEIPKGKRIQIIREWLERNKKEKKKRGRNSRKQYDKKRRRYPERYALRRRISMAIEKYEDLWDSFNSFLILTYEKEQKMFKFIFFDFFLSIFLFIFR